MDGGLNGAPFLLSLFSSVHMKYTDVCITNRSNSVSLVVVLFLGISSGLIGDGLDYMS